jgi:hypothetical protein
MFLNSNLIKSYKNCSETVIILPAASPACYYYQTNTLLPTSSAHTSLACTPLFTKHRTAGCSTYRHYSSFLQLKLLPATLFGFVTDLSGRSIYFEMLTV